MCPLPFTLDRMYNFVSDRFDDPSAYVQEQSLQWLQVCHTLVSACFLEGEMQLPWWQRQWHLYRKSQAHRHKHTQTHTNTHIDTQTCTHTHTLGKLGWGRRWLWEWEVVSDCVVPAVCYLSVFWVQPSFTRWSQFPQPFYNICFLMQICTYPSYIRTVLLPPPSSPNSYPH